MRLSDLEGGTVSIWPPEDAPLLLFSTDSLFAASTGRKLMPSFIAALFSRTQHAITSPRFLHCMRPLQKASPLLRWNRSLSATLLRALSTDTPTVSQSTKVGCPYIALPSTLGPLHSALAPSPCAKYAGRYTVAVLTGDGVSPEMMEHVKSVYYALRAPVDFDEVTIDNNSGEKVVREAVLAVKRNGVALKGSLKTVLGMKSNNLMIRNELGLYAYVLHCYSFPGVITRHKDVDIVVIRENSEGEYRQLEHESVPGVVESMKIITREKSTKIAHFAFNYAVLHGRKKVTAVHKANIMKLSDGLFLQTCTEVAKLYPSIHFDSIIVDNCCMQLVVRPQQFDVMLLPNLYGNVVGAVCAGLVGGAGLVAGINLGEDYAVFEVGTRKQAQSLKGRNIANPVAMLLASADLLDHLGLHEKSTILRNAIVDAVSTKNVRTPDIGAPALMLLNGWRRGDTILPRTQWSER
ncbi:Isocitrate dehydrogenase NAD subunit gamma 1 mitochondrial [Taenia crassiceps]|uniref:Isocitrate dehydrogenase NAD subunit gamma 1 mitochondrial n=1 Tax=Taenia crassiceps TaxID=6207 RepID=A0ABR4Q634_9CEST